MSENCEKCATCLLISPMFLAKCPWAKRCSQSCNKALWHLLWYVVFLLNSMQQWTLYTVYLHHTVQYVTHNNHEGFHWHVVFLHCESSSFSWEKWVEHRGRMSHIFQWRNLLHSLEWFMINCMVRELDWQRRKHPVKGALDMISKTWTGAYLLVSDCLSVSNCVLMSLSKLFFNLNMHSHRCTRAQAGWKSKRSLNLPSDVCWSEV